MSPPTDLYKVLQVEPNAEPEVIRAAYRALALKYHPDVITGNQGHMADINLAWGILRDPETRATYDRERAAAACPVAVPPPETSYAMQAPLPTTPPGKPSGSVLDFGRYAGWSIGQIAAVDVDYLEWLARSQIGRSFQHEIAGLLAVRAAVVAAATTATRPRSSRRR